MKKVTVHSGDSQTIGCCIHNVQLFLLQPDAQKSREQQVKRAVQHNVRKYQFVVSQTLLIENITIWATIAFSCYNFI